MRGEFGMKKLKGKIVKIRVDYHEGGEIAFFDCEISKDSKETMLKICKGNLKLIFQWVWILFCCMLFPDQKYRSRVVGFHLLIQEQPLYHQSTSLCTSFHQNGEYRYLQLLLPQDTSYTYIFTCICPEIKPKEGNPQ